MPSTVLSSRQGNKPFRGFEHPNANFVYCPNQFFDVCLPNHSRGVIRLVAYILRKTLGWLDENGTPVEQNISASYRDLITKAGLSRGGIRKAIDEAIAGGFISCTREPRVTRNGRPAQTARYTLRWDTANQYVRDAGAFEGFYAAEGHRTPVPNAFFDRVIPHETLGDVKVVGTVLRHTVGYANQFGTGRRTHAQLSYSYIQKIANLLHRPTLANALHEAIERGYIRCVSEGHFDPHGGGNSRPASYAVKWLDQAALDASGSKTEPAETKRFKNRTELGSKTEPTGRFKNRTDRKTDSNNTDKQQDGVALAAAENSKSVQLLVAEGFDQQAAQTLARAASFDEIRKQTIWIELRNPRENHLGMLRRSIEQN